MGHPTNLATNLATNRATHSATYLAANRATRSASSVNLPAPAIWVCCLLALCCSQGFGAQPSPVPSPNPGKLHFPDIKQVLSKRVKGVAVKPAQPGIVSPTIKARSTVKKAPPPQPTYFSLQKSAPGKLVLGFATTDPQLEMDRTVPFAIQLTTDPVLQITPSILLRTDWPKGAAAVTLAYKGGVPNRDNLVRGKGAYTVCNRTTKECKKVRCLIKYSFKP